ncbi:Uncharacterised protein [Achromobacter xylosoxidans]|nr:Uncharacterised protein [Achromobacter xylosoxidans]
MAPELGQQVAAHARQPVVVGQRRVARQLVGQVQPGLRAEGHAHRHRAIQFHHRRRHGLRQRVVQRHDARPVGVLRLARAGVAGRQAGLQRVRAAGAAQAFGALQRGQAAPDQQRVPAAAILFQQQHRPAFGVAARMQARGLQFHQRHQPVHLALVGRQLRQDAAQPQRFVAQRRAHPVFAGGGGIAFVEDQVDHFQHRGQPRRAFPRPGHLERHARRRQAALGAHDALGDGRLRGQESARDLGGGQPAQQAQRQRHTRLGRKQRVAGGEHQAQQVVADVVLARGVQRLDEIGFDVGLQRLQFVADLLVLAAMDGVQPQAVAGAVLRGGHEPGSRVVRHAGGRPALQRGHQRVLGQFLGQADIAHQARDAGDDAGGLDAPDGFDGAVGCRRSGRRGHACGVAPGSM